MKAKLLILTFNVSILLIPSAHASKRSTRSVTEIEMSRVPIYDRGDIPSKPSSPCIVAICKQDRALNAATPDDGKASPKRASSPVPARKHSNSNIHTDALAMPATAANNKQDTIVNRAPARNIHFSSEVMRVPIPARKDTKLSKFTEIVAKWRMKALEIEKDLEKDDMTRAFYKAVGGKPNIWDHDIVISIVYQEHKARLVELFKKIYKDQLPDDPFSRDEPALERKATAITNDLLLYWYNTAVNGDYIISFVGPLRKTIMDRIKRLHYELNVDDWPDEKPSHEQKDLASIKLGKLAKCTEIVALCIKEFDFYTQHKLTFINLFMKFYKQMFPSDPLSFNARALKRKAREITDEVFHLCFSGHFNNYKLVDEKHIPNKDNDKVRAAKLADAQNVEDETDESEDIAITAKVLNEIDSMKEQILANNKLAQLSSIVMPANNGSGNPLYHIELINRLVERYMEMFKLFKPEHQYWPEGRLLERARQTILSLGSPSDYWNGKLAGMHKKS